jgi:hypothetical protein
MRVSTGRVTGRRPGGPFRRRLAPVALFYAAALAVDISGPNFPCKPPRLASLFRALFEFTMGVGPALWGVRQRRGAHQLARHGHHLALFDGLGVIVADEM